MSGLTKWCARIEHPTQVGGLVRQAFAEMKSGYIRPTGLEIPLDVLSKECEVDLGDLTGPPPPPPLDDDQIDAIAKLLGAAKAPAIFIGTGAIEAGEEVLALAEILQAPVISNRTARGVVDDRHYLSHTSATGNKLWRDADVVLAVGTKLQAPRMAWAKNPDRKIIVIDIEPRFLHRLGRPHLGMVADGKSALGALATAVGKYNIARPSRQTELEEMKADRMAELETQLAGQFAYMRVLRDALGEDDILVDELTQVGYPLRVAYPVYQPRTLLGTAYQGTLGAGFATALGVKIGCPDKKVLSINGDGGFMYNVQELSTAAQQNIPLVTVVFADGAYGNVRRMQQYDHGGRLIATELRNPDFVALAESFGVNAMRAEGPEELGRALKEAFDAKAPVLIESPVGEFPDPWPVLMPRG